MNVLLALVVFATAILFVAIVYRRRSGFGVGETVARDNITLRSQRYGLIGRPDRIVRKGRHLIVEDKKPSKRIHDSHRLQMGVYMLHMLLVEEQYGIRPPHGVVVLGNGQREKVPNTKELRERVLDITSRIREARKDIEAPQPGVNNTTKCRACAQRHNCDQRVA